MTNQSRAKTWRSSKNYYDQSCRQNCTIRQTSMSYYLLYWVCKYVQLNLKAVNIQCLHAQQLCTIFKNLICTAVFILFTATCFFRLCARQVDTINSHLTKIYMYGTVNVKTMLLDFFYLCIYINIYRYNFVNKYDFAICSYSPVHTRSVSLYTTLIPKLYQTTKVKMFVHMGYVNSYMAVTTNGNISN